jgi:predicted nuclease of restriction endonuclease-like (RecB) superfamily
LDIRDPYIFEFLGLKPREVMSESHLEDRLLDKLQDFLLELGNVSCFDTLNGRQKRYRMHLLNHIMNTTLKAWIFRKSLTQMI